MKVYLSLGSNIGDRLEQLSQAKKKLEENNQINILKASSIYETEPWPKTDQSNDHSPMKQKQKWHLNQVTEAETSLTPTQLLSLIKKVEHEIGRRKRAHWDAREIDIDILLYEDHIINQPDVKIPHLYMTQRQFILVPLVEMAPDLKDPVSKQAYSDILEDVKREDGHRVRKFNKLF